MFTQRAYQAHPGLRLFTQRAYQAHPGLRLFMHGLPGNGFINFGKVVNGYQTFYLETGIMYIPYAFKDDTIENIIERCGFDMRNRHPITFEPLDTE